MQGKKCRWGAPGPRAAGEIPAGIRGSIGAPVQQLSENWRGRVVYRRRPQIDAWVLLEAEWILRSRYGLAREQIRTAFGAMLETTAIVVKSPATLEEALMLFGQNSSADFADCVHVANAR